MTCGQNFEHAIFFEMSPEKVLSKCCHAKIHKRSFKLVPEWLPLSLTERLYRRLLTFTGRYTCSSTVAENSESWLMCLFSVALLGYMMAGVCWDP